jgi:hypothetical protein
MESMPDGYYVPEEANLGPREVNPAKKREIRPGKK